MFIDNTGAPARALRNISHTGFPPLCGTCGELPGTRGTRSRPSRRCPSSRGPGRRTVAAPLPPARPTGPSPTAAWIQSACSAGTHLTPGKTLRSISKRDWFIIMNNSDLFVSSFPIIPENKRQSYVRLNMS